jgi:hypothetical protein
MSDATAGLVPAVVWTVLWAVMALWILYATARVYYRSTVRKSVARSGQPI